MSTLQAYPKSENNLLAIPGYSLEDSLNRLASSLTRATSETANAFFCISAPAPTKDSNALRESGEIGSHTCSQRNIGDKFEMICNLEVGKADWNSFFTAGESDRFKLDTFCEMANCICGSLLSDPGFSDQFGYMIPCVPWSLSSAPQSNAGTLRGAFRLSEILVYFSISVQLSTCALDQTDSLTTTT
jgi:hypothetical protein